MVMSPSLPAISTCATAPETRSRSGETSSNLKASAISRGLGGELLGLGDGLLDGADHVEGRFRQVVVVAVAKSLEALDRVGQLDERARPAGEYLGDMEGLRQEALDLAGAGDGDLVLFRQLVHAENGDDVLERLVALQDLLHAASDRVMLLADDARIEHARGRIERVHGGVDALLGDGARQN